MKVTIDIKDNKADFILELLRSFSFVKIKTELQEPSKKQILKELKKSVEEVNLIKAGKLKGIPARKLLDEL